MRDGMEQRGTVRLKCFILHLGNVGADAAGCLHVLAATCRVVRAAIVPFAQ